MEWDSEDNKKHISVLQFHDVCTKVCAVSKVLEVTTGRTVRHNSALSVTASIQDFPTYIQYAGRWKDLQENTLKPSLK